jgi:hypothetical protein
MFTRNSSGRKGHGRCQGCGWRLSAPGRTADRTTCASGPRRSERARKSGKGGIRTRSEPLPVRRIHGSPGPFPVAHAWIDADRPSGSRHASANGRFPTATRSDSNDCTRCARGSPGGDEVLVCEEQGNEVAATRRGGELGNRRAGWKGLGFAGPRADHARKRPSSTHRSASRSIRRRGAWPCTAMRTLCHEAESSQEMQCNFFQFRTPLPNLLSWQRDSRSTSWIHSRPRDFSLATERIARPSGHAPAIGSLGATAELRRCRAGPFQCEIS